MKTTTLMRKVLIDTRTGCWLWAGYRTSQGYGWVKQGGVHRLMYEALVGPIPEGLELDHLCRIRWCVNPAHLEPVTHDVNLDRAKGNYKAIAAALAARTHCKHGHEFTPENTRTYKGGRVCVACNLADQRRWRERQRAKKSTS